MASDENEISSAPDLAQQQPAPARPRPFDHQQGFQLLTLLRRVAAEADGTDLEAGRYAISCDLLNSINNLLFAIDMTSEPVPRAD